jgi:hypothetical protein
VVVFLETAELRAKNRQDINMNFWHENVDRIIEFNDKIVLRHKGSMSQNQMEEFVDGFYEKFDAWHKSSDAQKTDEDDIEELKQIAQNIKLRKPEE